MSNFLSTTTFTKRPATLCALIAAIFCMGARAQVTEIDSISQDAAYYIYNPHFTAYAIYSPTHSATNLWAAQMIPDASHAIKDQSYALPLDSANRNSAWMIVEFRNNHYIYNIGARKFLTVGYTQNNGVTRSCTLDSVPQPVVITQGNGGFHFTTTMGHRDYMCAAPQLGYPVSVWSTDDAGALWTLIADTLVQSERDTAIALLEQAFPPTGSLSIITDNGNIYSDTSGGAMADEFPLHRDLVFAAQTLSGYTCTQGIAIRHGHNLDGPQFADSVRQWSEYVVEATNGLITIPADSVDGDIRITARWERTGAEAYQLVFSDDFNGTGEPDSTKWTRAVRQGATWNRWLSPSPLVVFEQGGALHTKAIPNPDTSTDNVPMLTGGIKSEGLFSFQYGYAEARIKTHQWRGNFPAFWMMPQDNSAGWPNAGEIDIWETIDTSTNSWHTVHTNWTYNLHHNNNSGQYRDLNYDCWHTFAVEWDSTSLTWYADGQKVWTYYKSSSSSELSQGQWPFDAPFYLILNQSVGNGSWAANADTSHTYETLFDWVRVYQLPHQITGIRSATATPNSAAPSGGNAANAEALSTTAACYNLHGQRLAHPNGGIYIQGGKKFAGK